ncbi:MAG: TonB-dependent receptor [Sterolibacterium sp.]|jgi:iron complex outermembrane receptor protein
MNYSARTRLKPLALLLAAVPATGWAQETTLPAVIISAPMIDNQASNSLRVEEANLARLRAATSDTASLLRDIPGVSLYGAGGVSSLPAIRGLADDRLRIKVDGMDLISACANHMNPPLSYIDPANVDSIKVFAGIAPVSMGGDSIGGTIAVASAAPEFAKTGQGTLLKGQAGIFYRSNANANGGNLSAAIANEQLSMTYNGSSTQAGDYQAAKDFKAAGPAAMDRNWLAGDVVGSSRYKSENQSLAFALRHDSHLVELKLGWQDIPYQGFPNQRMDMTGNDSRQINLRYTGQYGWGGLEVRVYKEKTRHQMDFAEDKQFVYGAAPGIVAPGMPMDTEGRTTGTLLKADVALSERDHLKVGGEILRYQLNDWWPPSPSVLPAGFTVGGMAPNTFWNINNGERDRLGLFAEWEARWNPRWLTLLGARSERVKMNAGPVQGYNNSPMFAGYVTSANAFNVRDRQRTDDNVDLTALARYTPDATRSLEFGYAQKTRSPNLYERYSWSKNGMALIMNNFVGDGNGYLGDPDLKPEQAHTLSATLDWHDAARAWEFKLTPHYTYVADYIDAVRCFGSGMMMAALCGGAANNTRTTGFVHLQYANQSARLYGLDVSGRFQLGSSVGLGEFSASGVLNYVNGKNRTSGDDLYNIMPPNARLAVAHQLGPWNSSVELQLVKEKSNVSDVRFEMRTPGYSLVNLRTSYAWNQARLDLGVENLFDRFYSLPLGGAYVGQGMTMSLNGVRWGTPVPGMGRSIYAGLTVKF